MKETASILVWIDLLNIPRRRIRINGALILQDGRILTWADNTLRIWSRNGTLLNTMEGHTDMVYDALLLSDGRILSWSDDNSLRYWSDEGVPIKTMEGHNPHLEAETRNKDGKLVSKTHHVTEGTFFQDKTIS